MKISLSLEEVETIARRAYELPADCQVEVNGITNNGSVLTQMQRYFDEFFTVRSSHLSFIIRQ